MSRIVIVARTRMRGDHVCIGAHDLDRSFRGVRLLDRHGKYWTTEAPFAVGDLWDMRYYQSWCRPPHVEDANVRMQRHVGRVPDLKNLVLRHIAPWSGSPEVLFDGLVRGTPSGTGYIAPRGPVPQCSTGYWIPSEDLQVVRLEESVRCMWTARCAVKRFTWVGVTPPPEVIERGSLVRVSLARLWKPPSAPEGYYVQISGVL